MSTCFSREVERLGANRELFLVAVQWETDGLELVLGTPRGGELVIEPLPRVTTTVSGFSGDWLRRRIERAAL